MASSHTICSAMLVLHLSNDSHIIAIMNIIVTNIIFYIIISLLIQFIKLEHGRDHKFYEVLLQRILSPVHKTFIWMRRVPGRSGIALDRS
jgi:hypothetical protein